jgi:flagellar capping protein FliD
MITQIQLGNIFQSGDQTVLGGSASGLDTETLVNGLVETRRLPAVQLESRLEENAAQQSALSDLRQILSRFQDTADFLRNPPGVDNDAENIFEYRSATLVSNTTVSADNYATAIASPGADVSSFDLTVEQLATFNTKVTDTFALANADTVAVGGGLPFNAGTLVIGASGENVLIEAGDTLNEVVSKINAVSDLSKVRANIIQVSDGQYRLSLKTTETGADLNYDFGIPATPDFLTNDAIFRLDATDIDGDGDTLDNPAIDQAVAAPVDGTGGTTISTSGVSPLLDVDGSPNGLDTFDFSAGNQAYLVANSNDLNAAGPYAEKTFAFSFQTGADISGTQTIYEQGGANHSMGLFIAPDPGNANAPTLYGVMYDANWGATPLKTVNLGAVTADTNYEVVLDFDASANPTVVDAANTFTGYVNGVQVDQADTMAEFSTHTRDIAIGSTINFSRTPTGANLAAGSNFLGSINEVSQFNRSLSPAEITELSTYYDDKFAQPVSSSANIFNIGFAVEEDAVDASFTIDDTVITRSSNSVDDVVENITLNLTQVTPPGTELTLNIEEDTEVARDAILNFVDTYNELRVFFSQQTLREDDGSAAEDAALLGNNTLNLTMSRILNETARIVEGITGGDPSQLSEIGIEFTDFQGNDETPFTRNIMVVDEAILTSALESNFDAVRRIFAFDFTSDEPNLEVFSRTNDLDVSNFTLDINVTAGTYQATYDNGGGPITIDLDATALSNNSGFLLKGQEGTVLEGLKLIYASNDDSFGINVTTTQGVGDTVYNSLEDILDDDNGLLTTEENSLVDSAERLQTEIERIDEAIERYRQRLLDQFAGLEAFISQAETILQSLDAQAQAAANR